MKYNTPEISWHGRDPIYSVDFQFLKGSIRRLATCGTDRHIRVWEVTEHEGKSTVEFLSSLTRHTRTVNVVRFSPDGQVLASGGDDSVVMLWRLNPMPAGGLFQEDEQENKENWSMYKVLRSHLEDVYDICWSSCGKFLISGSVDNSAILWNVKKGVRLGIFPDHKSFVQGVAFDPLMEYLATMSSDRSLRVYSYESKNCLHTVNKVSFSGLNQNGEDEKVKDKSKMFHDDTMKSFFRRLCFTPDGLLLLVPSGCIEKGPGEEAEHTSYLFSRRNFSQPVMHLPGPNKATLAARACPVLFDLRKIPRKTKLPATTNKDSSVKVDSDSSNSSDGLKEWQKYETIFCLPYRVVFAIATEDAVLLYDTQQPQPFAYIANIHYHTISDITWAHDAKYLVVSSTDGFCTIISFEDGELGTPYKDQPLYIYSQKEIDDIELQKKKEKELSKKPKEKEEKDSKKVDVKPKTDVPKKEEPVVVEKTTSDVTPKHTSPAKNEEVKQPRRAQLITLIRSPSASKSCKPEKSVESNAVTTPLKPTEAKDLNKSKDLETKGASNDGKESSENVKKPRRIGITTLSVYKEPEPDNTESNIDRNEESLHLELEN